MDPQLDKTPGVSFVQQTSAEYASAGLGVPVGAIRSPESVGLSNDLPPARMMPQPMAAQPISNPSVVTPVGLDSTGNVTVDASNSADNGVSDQLDEEYISRAKAIVDRTKNDPFLQSKEIGKVKADYLRTKYNKQIRVAEDKAQ